MTARRKKAAKAPVRYRALTRLSLRQRPDRTRWDVWPRDTVFTPPPYMDVARALERGIIEPVADGGRTEVGGND